MASTTTIETRTVTGEQLTRACKKCFRLQRPVFIWGPPGIGKSEIVQGITDDLDGHMIDMRMALMAPDEIRGIPFYNKEKNVMEWAPPEDLPREAGDWPIIVLFLDEMNSAPPSVQAAGYQLVLNRRIGKFKLPDNCVIVAAGNRETDKGVTYRMPSPLANRFIHLELKVDFDSWFNWAVTNKVHPDVTGFLSFSKQDLFDFDPRSASRSFATPRSWVFVSELVSDEEDSDADLMTDLISGTVGEGLAIKFMAHRRFAADLPNVDDILSGKVTKLKTEEISAMYSLVISMCYELEDKHSKLDATKWHEMADYFFAFMMDNFKTELVVMGAKVALTTYNLPLQPGKLKNFDRFHKQYGKYIMAAVSN